MNERYKKIEIALMNEVKEIDSSLNKSEFEKIISAKFEFNEETIFNTKTKFIEFLEVFIPYAYKDLLSKNKSFMYIGIFLTKENDEIISTSYNINLINAMEIYGDNINGVLEATKMLLNN